MTTGRLPGCDPGVESAPVARPWSAILSALSRRWRRAARQGPASLSGPECEGDAFPAGRPRFLRCGWQAGRKSWGNYEDPSRGSSAPPQVSASSPLLGEPGLGPRRRRREEILPAPGPGGGGRQLSRLPPTLPAM